MRPEIESVLIALLQASEVSREVSLDGIGEAFGTLAVTAEEIDQLLTDLEDRGRRVVGPSGGGGESRLKTVIAAARALEGELGRKARPAEIAARAGITEEQVRHALALARVIARG
jgi:hypothetical protein